MDCPLRFPRTAASCQEDSGNDQTLREGKAPILLMEHKCPLNESSSTSTKYSKSNYPTNYLGNNFYRTMRLSPDGYRLLTVDERQNLYFYALPYEVISRNQYYVVSAGEESVGSAAKQSPMNLVPYHIANLGENIYDVIWGQHISTSAIETEAVNNSNTTDYSSAPYNAIFVSMKDHPIHLYSIEDLSKPVSNYVGYNHLDEVESHHALCYQQCGGQAKIYAGAEKKIRIFDVSKPGHEALSTIHTAGNKYQMGQRGIISTLALQPNISPDQALLAAGCYAGSASSVSLYQEKEGNSGHNSVMDISGFSNGITSLTWTTCGTYLWVGTRNSAYISCYDIRNQKSIVCSIDKEELEQEEIVLKQANQRMAISMDPWSRYLATGSYSNGLCNMFDVYSGKKVLQLGSKLGQRVNSCIFHPYASLLLTLSGNRIFSEEVDEDSTSSESEEDTDMNINHQVRKRVRREDVSTRNSSALDDGTCAASSNVSLWVLDREPIIYDVNSTTSNVEEAEVEHKGNSHEEESSSIDE